jgi:hypothetical protein
MTGSLAIAGSPRGMPLRSTKVVRALLRPYFGSLILESSARTTLIEPPGSPTYKHPNEGPVQPALRRFGVLKSRSDLMEAAHATA